MGSQNDKTDINDANKDNEVNEDKEDNEAKTAINNALRLLKTIKTLDDLKEHKDEILTIIEDFIKYGVESLREIIKRSLKPAEIKLEFDKFQKTQELFYKELNEEMMRVSKLEGAQEYIVSLKDEMEERLKPYAQELVKLMGEIMSSMLGSIMEGIDTTKQGAAGNRSKEDDGSISK
jgi:hypothetical protein